MLNKSSCNADSGYLTIAAMDDTPDPNEIWLLFGPWLKLQRKRKGKLQKEVAAAADVHPVHYAKIEGGTSGTKKETLDKIINFLGLDAKIAYKRAGLWPEDINLPPDNAKIPVGLPAQAQAIFAILDPMPADERSRVLTAVQALYGEAPPKPKGKAVTLSDGRVIVMPLEIEDDGFEEVKEGAAEK